MKPLIRMAALAATLGLAACAEKPQTATAKTPDSPPWQGAQDGYVASGWKPGDKASWEEQMKTRSQGQNEYSRAPAQP